MNIEVIMATAQTRLSTITEDATFLEAARLLGSGTVRMLVVCKTEGHAVGIVTRTDAMRHIERNTAATTASIVDLMNATIISARLSDDIFATWQMMRKHGLNHVPILDADGRALGVLTNEDALQVLLTSEQYEEHILADYVAGIGYR